MANYLREYGSGLISNGYRIVPIKRGCKFPSGIREWTQINADLNQLGQWASAGFEGVGVLTRDNPGIDLDILDADVCNTMIKKVLEKHPGGLIRIGKAPKTLIACRTTTPFKKVRSCTYEDNFGDQHAVEILGDGQQYVAYAEHPDTLRPYVWIGDSNGAGPGIFEVESASLPAICLEDARLVVAWFEEIALQKMQTEGWVKTRDGQGGNPADAEEEDENENENVLADFANPRPRLGLTDENIRRALASVPADDYDKWIKVGMALWHECDGSEDGFNYWHEWSQTSDNYENERSCRIRWRGFRPGNGRTTTFATVLHWAREVRMGENPLGEFKDRFVYVADGDMVHDLEGLGHDKPFLLREFKNMTANIRIQVMVRAPLANDPDRRVPKEFAVHELWLKDTDRQTAYGFAYVPGKPRLLWNDERCYVNEFWMPTFVNPCKTVTVDGVKRLDEQCCNELLAIFFRHMEYIIPIEAEREWFYSWMAYNIQQPGERCKVTPLLIATDHGTGRGWIAQLMVSLLGLWNCSKTKMGTLNGESGAGQYQEYMNNNLLCSIEEVKDGGKRYGVTDTIRDFLTEKTLEINLKYGLKATKPVYTNFFWMSNHADAIVLTEEDRRINVFRTEDGPKGSEYYERLYGWMEGNGRTDSAPGTSGKTGDGMEGLADGDPDPDDRANGNNGNRNSGVPSADQDKDAEIYDRGGLNVSPGVACLWHWLNQRDLTGFNSYRSMTNQSRRDMIENNMTEVERVFHNVRQNPPYPVMTLAEIQNHILSGGGSSEDYSLDGESDMNFMFTGKEKGQIQKLVQQHLQKQEKVGIKISSRQTEEGAVTTLKGQVPTRWVRGWSFVRGQKFTKAEIREMYKTRKK